MFWRLVTIRVRILAFSLLVLMTNTWKNIIRSLTVKGIPTALIESASM